MSHRTIYEDIRSVISLLESASGPMRFVKRDGLTTAPSGPDHALASLSAAQVSEKGLLTSGTYGHTGSTSSRSADLSKSLENRLRQKTDGLGSTLYKLTWKHWDLPSGRQICALRASVRRTSGKDSGSMGPWPTPMACDARGSAGRGKKELPNIAQLSGWPTTSCSNDRAARPAIMKREDGTKNQQRLQDLVALSGWGTPSVGDDNSSRMGEEAMAREWVRPGGSKSSLAKQAAVLSGWPTTRAADGDKNVRTTEGAMKEIERKGSPQDLPASAAITQPIRLTASGETLIGSDAAMESSGQLNPAHPRWLMGLPPVWDDCAVTAMQSLPRSRKHSSKQHKGGEK